MLHFILSKTSDLKAINNHMYVLFISYRTVQIHYQCEKRLARVKQKHAKHVFQRNFLSSHALKLNVKSFCFFTIWSIFLFLGPHCHLNCENIYFADSLEKYVQIYDKLFVQFWKKPLYRVIIIKFGN